MVNGNLHFSLAVIASEEEAQKSTSLHFPLIKPTLTHPITSETPSSQLELYVKLGIKTLCVLFCLKWSIFSSEDHVIDTQIYTLFDLPKVMLL